MEKIPMLRAQVLRVKTCEGRRLVKKNTSYLKPISQQKTIDTADAPEQNHRCRKPYIRLSPEWWSPQPSWMAEEITRCEPV